MKLKLKATTVFDRNYRALERIIVNQGGTGSSKSYSLAQLIAVKAFEVHNKTFTIVRKSMPSLKATAMRDFINILTEAEVYNENNHDKTNNIYILRGNKIEFVGLDEPQKVRSRRRDYLWINEANELSLESYRQLSMRTNVQIYLDFNPSDEFHWIYDEVLTRNDCRLIKSTYLDNPFLPDTVIKEIERYKETDQNYWNIYGLGERGASEARIYASFELIDDLPESGEKIYGLDFGFNNPTVLAEVKLKDDDIYAKQLLHQSYLTNSDLIVRMGDLGISKSCVIYADSAEPQRIEELKRAGYNVVPADKSVKDGIDAVKRRKRYITKDSIEGIKEMRTYSWKTKDGKVLDEPVKLNDHFPDTVRYAVHTHTLKQKFSFDFM